RRRADRDTAPRLPAAGGPRGARHGRLPGAGGPSQAGPGPRGAAGAVEAAEACRAALDLWRGPALGGVGGRLIEAAAARLEEERLAVLLDRVGADLELGRHGELVAELGAPVAAPPLPEGL